MIAHERFDIVLAADHPVFAGHFPSHPIVPGALLLDEVVRLAGQHDGKVAWTIRSAKFVHPATPGDALSVALSASSNGNALDFCIESGERLIAAGSLMRADACE